MSRNKRRITYDRFWGALLLLTCVLPARIDGPLHLPGRIAEGRGAWEILWLILGALAGIFALVAGLSGWRGRTRHFLNFLLGVILLSMPMAAPVIWERFPHANPGRLPVGDLAAVGWVLLLALTAIYAGSGIRVVRPSQVVGQALGALGALLVAVFAFLPLGGQEISYGASRIKLLVGFGEHWRELMPFLLFAAAALSGMLNLVRSPAEVALARVTRFLIVAGMLFWLAIPFLADSERLSQHLPTAWGTLRLLAPLFLSLDGAIAFTAISITRASE